MHKMDTDSNELYRKEDIITKLKEIFTDERIIEVSTEGYDLTKNPKNKNASRAEWANCVVSSLFGENREKINKTDPRKHSTGEYNFVYIKFAQIVDSPEKKYGIVVGKSSFHSAYSSDVWFYGEDRPKGPHKVLEDMKKNGMEWDKTGIVIIKNMNVLEHKEAHAIEKHIKDEFKLNS